MSKPLVVVTGKNGQLGWELQQSSLNDSKGFDFLFVGREELDLTTPSSILPFFEKYKPSYFINCAAYTAVDKAETDQETAYTVNAESVSMVAQQCNLNNCVLISISTDYVFDGNGVEPYKTETPTNPVNYYGYTKWLGEKLALENNPQTIIIRTSWVYSEHGNNFVKTMLRLMKERTELKVVSDQIGCPTYAADLAEGILHIIQLLQSGQTHFGIYHFSNSGVISWFEFATAIRNMAKLDNCTVLPQSSAAYPTPAKRPAYSVMDCSKIQNDFGVSLKSWQESLSVCLSKLV